MHHLSHICSSEATKKTAPLWRAQLLERDPFLNQLDAILHDVAAGTGRTVLISGEAGIGKTALVECFAGRCEPDVHVLWGACEALSTPRPLGPLYDIVLQMRHDMPELSGAGTNRAAIFSAFLQQLQVLPSPTVIVFEDVHWADASTVDLLKFLGRRIHRMPVMLIATYRDEEVPSDHPLRMLLGDLPSMYVERMPLPPLSEDAVSALAGAAGRRPGNLHAVTSGNPFFVTEVLANREDCVPVSVRDAVLARAGRLSPQAQEVLEMVSVIPMRSEEWLVEEILNPDHTDLEECCRTGMLGQKAGTFSFRHELARRAVEDSLSVARRRHLHRRVLAKLRDRDGVQKARLVYHADMAGEGEAVLQFAREAALDAASIGAHREAAAHYETALRYVDRSSTEQYIEFLEALSYECYLTHQLEKSLGARQTTLGLWRKLGRRREEGLSLHWISKLYLFIGRHEEAERYAEEALSVLECLPEGYELAYACCNRANLYMLREESEEAIRFASRAISLVKKHGAAEGFPTETLINSFNSIGVALLMDQDDSWRWGTDCAMSPPSLQHGVDELEKSLNLALEHDFHELAARAYTNLACSAVIHRDYVRAEGYLEAGVTYCGERDLDSWNLSMRAYRARMLFEQGKWEQAVRVAEQVLGHTSAYSIAKIPALLVLGRTGIRRGDESAVTLLEEACDLARSTEDFDLIGTVAAAFAEAAWLDGNLKSIPEKARMVFESSLLKRRPWIFGELAFWMWRSDSTVPSDGAALPFAFQMAGNWQSAAEAWRRLGCPYEEAMALSDGDEAAQFEALGLFEKLGAVPAARKLRRKMQHEGTRGVPRGPRPRTRANPAGLTARQMDVLELLAEGLTNAEIAERLFISPKTVDHHVSAVLARLEVGCRTEAAAVAIQQELIGQAPA